jgi:predicted NBD/HSP70 family sugar kinase
LRPGTNLPWVGSYNRGIVLEAIRLNEGASRAEIARRTGLTPQTVSNIVRRLLQEGLVKEAGRQVTASGKPRTRLRVNPEAGHAIGVQIDGWETSLVVVNLAGEILDRRSHPTVPGEPPEAALAAIAEAVAGLISSSGIPEDAFMGLGVACPGPLDAERGIVHHPPNLQGWHEVDLKGALEERLGIPTAADNDATAAAIGERWFRGAREAHNFLFVYMGIGLGAGLYIEDQVYRGSAGMAGELGHVVVDPRGPQCSCGNQGCLETFCSPVAILEAVNRRLKAGQASSLRGRLPTNSKREAFGAIARAAAEGDDLGRQEVARAASVLAAAVSDAIALLDLELVVLGRRGFRHASEIYRASIEKALSRVIGAQHRKVRVELSEVGEEAGAVGAASLVFHAAYAPPRTGGLTR